MNTTWHNPPTLLIITSLSLAGLSLSLPKIALSQSPPPSSLPHPDSLIANSTDDLAEANQLYQQVKQLNSQGKYSEAIPLAERMLQLYQNVYGEDHQAIAYSLNELGILYDNQGRYSEAEPLYRQALEMTKRLLGEEHPHVAQSLNNLALLYRSQGRYSEAEPLYLQALEMRKRLLGEEHPDIATSLNDLALLYDNQGRFSEALPLYRQASEMYKRLLGEEHPWVATSLNNLALLYDNQGRFSEALPLYRQASEMYKRLLGEEHPWVATSLNNLAVLYANLNDIDNTLTFLQQGLNVEEYNLAYNLASGFERQKRDYLQTMFWSTQFAPSFHLHHAANNPEAANLALTTIFRRKGRILDVSTNSLQRLRQNLTPENQTFTYLTSGRDLLRLQNPSPSHDNPVLIADPYFQRPGEFVADIRFIDLAKKTFAPLPGTAEEAEAIGQLLNITPLMGTQATERAVKQVDSPSILHIATHGFFESNPQSEAGADTINNNPLLLSGLILAGFRVGDSGGEDGILTAQEVSALDLVGTKLVVLSACDTGVGTVDAGEGIYGLRRALVLAGAESQVMSLWKVSDSATKDLMVNYYQKLRENQGRSEALRQTQLEMLESGEYQHPYYWAAFIPSGDWTPMER